jgi:DNA helicase IV
MVTGPVRDSAAESDAAESDAAESDAVLDAERAYLRASRESLRQMREEVLSLRALGGDPVSEEYLKADLYRRAEALADLPDTPLFFGRLDLCGSDGAGGEQLHIGRRHVHDAAGKPMVIDWRAPVSRAFYRASPTEPMGVSRRRRFGFDGGQLSAFEDEDLTAAAERPAAEAAPEAAPDAAPASRIVTEEIERPRSGPMRDIVATIQPDQDDIVRLGAADTVCVQGAPGTGKTAVGLHRVAYLLYAHRERMSRGGVLVIGPNRAFLGYIRNVLPALGEMAVTQLTVGELAGAALRVRGADSPAAAAVKGDARMAGVLRRALWSHLREPAEALELPRGTRRWRVPGHQLAILAQQLRARGVRYAAGREMLFDRIAHVILSRMEAAGQACDDRTHAAVRRSAPVRAAVAQVWPAVDPAGLVLRLLCDPDLLALAADGVLDSTEQRAIQWPKAPRSARSAPWSHADAVLIDEARDLIERTQSLAHVVVDEAQDLSPMECRAIGRRCATGSATVLGDLAQGTTPWAAVSWPALLGHLGKPAAPVRALNRGYRVPRQILEYAGRLLPHIGDGLAAAVSVRQSPGSLRVTSAAAQRLPALVAAVCAELASSPGSVGVIAAEDQAAALGRSLAAAGLAHTVTGRDDAGLEPLSLVPAGLAKGLEFDHVVVVEPARIAGSEPYDLHRLRQLYVALTRAVSSLCVLHAEPLPAPLAGRHTSEAA